MEISGTVNGLELTSAERHYCTSHIDGDWIIWRCPICCDNSNNLFPYERRLNWKTGEMKPPQNRNEGIDHSGFTQGDPKTDINQPLTKNLGEN